MVRVRDGSASAGSTTQLIDDDVEVVEPSTMKSPKKGTATYGKKGNSQPETNRLLKLRYRKLLSRFFEQIEKHQTDEQNAEEQQTAEPSTRKSPRTRSNVQTAVLTAQRSGKKKRSARAQSEAQPEKEPTPLPKFIDDDARERFEWIS